MDHIFIYNSSAYINVSISDIQNNIPELLYNFQEIILDLYVDQVNSYVYAYIESNGKY